MYIEHTQAEYKVQSARMKYSRFHVFVFFSLHETYEKKILDVLVLLYITAFVYVNNRFACVVVKMENCSVVNVVIDFIVVFLKLSFFVLLMLLGALFMKTL